MRGWWLDSGHEDGLFQGKHGTGLSVKYRVDYFLDNFFGPFFLDHFKGEGKHTVSAEGGVGGRVLLLREWYLILIDCIPPLPEN